MSLICTILTVFFVYSAEIEVVCCTMAKHEHDAKEIEMMIESFDLLSCSHIIGYCRCA